MGNMESKTTQIPEVAKDELEAPSSSSSDEQPQSEATTCPITKNVTDVRNTFYNLNILLKHQLDFLRTAVKEHRNMTNKQRSSNMKLLASIQQALNANMNSLRIKPNPFGLTVISARLAGIKESMSVVSNRLDAVEINTNDLTLALGRLNWREAHHIMLNNIYSNANLAMAYDSISIHEMVSVFAPEIKVPRKDSADEDWPEQFRDITIDTICPICHLELTEDVSFLPLILFLLGQPLIGLAPLV